MKNIPQDSLRLFLLSCLASAGLLAACGGASQSAVEPEPQPVAADTGAKEGPAPDCDGMEHHPNPHQLETLPMLKVVGPWTEDRAACLKDEWLQGALSLQHDIDPTFVTAILTRSRHTHLKVAPLSAEHWELLATIDTLQALEVFEPTSGAGPGANYEALAGMEALRSLATNIPVTHESISELAKLSQLEHLRIETGEVDAADASQLASLTRLRSLAVPTALDDGLLAALTPLATLEVLRGGVSKDLTDAGMESLSSFATLRFTELDVQGSKVTGAHLDSHPFANLETLDLNNTAVSDAGLAGIAGLTKLKHLNIASTTVSDAGLVKLAMLTSLESLGLGGTNVKNPRWEKLSALSSLTHLSLVDTRVSDSGFRRIEELQSLTHLDLYGSRIGNGGLAQVAKLSNLVSLKLGATKISDAGMTPLTSLAGLRVLNLRNTKIGNAGLKRISGLGLRFLNLRGSKVSNAGLESIPETLEVLFVTVKQFSEPLLEDLKKRLPKLKIVLDS